MKEDISLSRKVSIQDFISTLPPSAQEYAKGLCEANKNTFSDSELIAIIRESLSISNSDFYQALLRDHNEN